MKRNPRGNKRFQKKKPAFAAKKKDADQDKQLVKIEKQIKKLEGGPELKTDYFNPALTGVSNPGAGQSFLLNGVARGTAYNERIGIRINCKSVKFNGCITMTNVPNATTARLVVYKHREPRGAFANVTDVLTYTGANVVYGVYNHLNVDGKDIKILYDKTWVWNPQVNQSWTNAPPAASVSGGVIPGCLKVKFDIPIPWKTEMDITTTTGAITDMIQNSVEMFFVSDKTSASNTGPTLIGTLKLNYTDD